MKIFFKSDFELIEHFLDANGDPLDISELNISLCYQTDKFSSYHAHFYQGAGEKCYIDPEDHSKLHVTFAGHCLGPGMLTRTITFAVANDHFPDDTQNIRTKELTSVELVNLGGNASPYSSVENTAPLVLFNHANATHRDDPDQHPIAAITGLEEALEGAGGSQLLTDYVYEYMNEGNATFIGRNKNGESTSDATWRIKIIWYVNNVLQVFRFENVAWDDRYNLI
ncbi:MAG: hypothetical protein II945_05175 [Bacteroidales bacterium]|nr:hypothetical protein [Bacteroidales bacterium]